MTENTNGAQEQTASLGRGAIRDLAARHQIRPTKSLGQNFLVDPNLARAIAAESGVGPGDRVVEVGAGLGSLTLALAATGASVLAIEFDRRLVAALREVVDGIPAVEVLQADAMKLDWGAVLGESSWTMTSNLPYNIAVPVTLDMLESAPGVDRFVVMVQREVGERLAAGPGDEAYGAVSVRVAYRALARIVRRIPATVFWPAPKVESVLVRLDRLEEPPVDADPEKLFRVVEAGFAQRRKTMRNALRRLGLGAPEADEVLTGCGIDPRARAESLGLSEFARIAGAIDG